MGIQGEVDNGALLSNPVNRLISSEKNVLVELDRKPVYGLMKSDES